MAKMQDQAATTSPIIALHFALANLAASETGTAVPVLGGVVNTAAVPKGGAVVGYGIQLSETVTAGSLDIDITVDGTSVQTIAADVASTTEFGGTIEFNNAAFSALDSIGVTYTTDGSFTPATADIGVTVYIMMEDFSV